MYQLHPRDTQGLRNHPKVRILATLREYVVGLRCVSFNYPSIPFISVNSIYFRQFHFLAWLDDTKSVEPRILAKPRRHLVQLEPRPRKTQGTLSPNWAASSLNRVINSKRILASHGSGIPRTCGPYHNWISNLKATRGYFCGGFENHISKNYVLKSNNQNSF